MARCPNCSYGLVLLKSRPKCKCALCGKLYPQKEIEAREFRELNKRERVADIDNIKRERKEKVSEMRELRKQMRYLFQGFPKISIEHRRKTKRNYYKKKKEKILQTNKEWALRNKDQIRKTKHEYYQKNKQTISQMGKIKRQENPEMTKIYCRIQNYRQRQISLALRYLKNEQHSPWNAQIFHSVSTFGLSYLLLHPQII